MPIYEYVCRDCGHELEQLQRMSDDTLTDCPACGQTTLKRKVSAAGFRLSGGGWYETDFKSDGKRNLTGAEAKSESSESGGKAESKSDGKTADGKTGKKKSENAAQSSQSGASGAKQDGAGKAGRTATRKSSST